MSDRHKINVLVLGAGGNVSQGIIKALRESNLPMTITGACIWEYSKGLYILRAIFGVGDANTGIDPCFVDIKPTTVVFDNFERQ